MRGYSKICTSVPHYEDDFNANNINTNHQFICQKESWRSESDWEVINNSNDDNAPLLHDLLRPAYLQDHHLKRFLVYGIPSIEWHQVRVTMLTALFILCIDHKSGHPTRSCLLRLFRIPFLSSGIYWDMCNRSFWLSVHDSGAYWRHIATLSCDDCNRGAAWTSASLGSGGFCVFYSRVGRSAITNLQLSLRKV